MPVEVDSARVDAPYVTAGNTRSRFFESEHTRHGRSRACRTARRGCSRRSASMTCGYDGVGCSVFLNNRYYDSATGVFLSVDPLVAATGEAYLYASGNPTTLSDPAGLDPGCSYLSHADCRALSYNRGSNASRYGLSSVGRSCDRNACKQTANFTFAPTASAGRVHVNLFIAARELGA